MMHGYIGASGSGKTYTMQSHASAAVRAGWRVVVMDLVEEWPQPGAWKTRPRYVLAETPDEARAAGSYPLVVYRPPMGADHEHATAADALAAVAIDAGPTILCLPEAQHACREHKPLPQHISEIVHRWRHRSVGARIWWDTQQLADVSKELYAASTRLHFFGGAHRRDGNRCRQLGGEPLLHAIDQCGRRALTGRAGYHVAIRPLDSRESSYTITRA